MSTNYQRRLLKTVLILVMSNAIFISQIFQIYAKLVILGNSMVKLIMFTFLLKGILEDTDMDSFVLSSSMILIVFYGN